MTDRVSDSWRGLDCLGVIVRQPTWPAFKAWFAKALVADNRWTHARTVFLANAHTLNLASSDAAYRDVLNRGDLVLNDGAGLSLYGRLAGSPFKYNFNGTDLIPRLFSEFHMTTTVFLLGGAPGRAESAAKELERRYVQVQVVGALDGFHTRDAVEAINAVRPDVLLVGMGNPLQERWIDDRVADLHVGLAIGVGALIDFLSGSTPRAPLIARRLRLEWAFRLSREPRRLFRRYIVGIPLFLARTTIYLLRHRGHLRV